MYNSVHAQPPVSTNLSDHTDERTDNSKTTMYMHICPPLAQNNNEEMESNINNRY